MKDFILICGFGKMGEELARKLHSASLSFVVIDNSIDRIEHAKNFGYKALLADASDLDTLKALHVSVRASSVICLTKSDVVNVSIILVARSLSKKVRIIAKANETKNEKKMLAAGANEVIGLKQGALVLAEFVNSPVLYQAIHELIADDKHVLAEELSIEQVGSGLSIKDLELDSYDCLLLGVSRGIEKFFFNPEEEFALQDGDKLVVIGRPKRIEGIRLKILREISRG